MTESSSQQIGHWLIGFYVSSGCIKPMFQWLEVEVMASLNDWMNSHARLEMSECIS
jgi:hypothetical protein